MIYNIDIPDNTVTLIQNWLDQVTNLPPVFFNARTVEELINFIINQNLPTYTQLATNFNDKQLLDTLKADSTLLDQVKTTLTANKATPITTVVTETTGSV